MNRIQNLFRRDDRFSAFSMGTVLVLLAVFMGIFSLTSLNEKATKGYLVNKLESEKQDLVRDAEITDMLNLRARSLETIRTSAIVTRMVKPDQIVYVTPITVVAQK